MIIINHLDFDTILDTIDGMPDFSGIEEPTLSILQTAWEEGKFQIINNPPPKVGIKTPNWQELATEILEGDLLPLFNRFTSEAINSYPISIPRNDINLIVNVIRKENALAASLTLLQQYGFVFTNEERQLWNNVIQELGFSSIVQIVEPDPDVEPDPN